MKYVTIHLTNGATVEGYVAPFHTEQTNVLVVYKSPDGRGEANVYPWHTIARIYYKDGY